MLSDLLTNVIAPLLGAMLGCAISFFLIRTDEKKKYQALRQEIQDVIGFLLGEAQKSERKIARLEEKLGLEPLYETSFKDKQPPPPPV